MRIDVNNLTLFGVDLRRPLRWWFRGLSDGAAPLREAFFHPVPRLRVTLDEPQGEVASLTFEALPVAASDWQPVTTLDTAALALMNDGALSQQLQAACGERAALAQLELMLPARQVLQRTLSLPAAVENELREVVGYQLSRLTPFPADQLYFDVTAQADAPAESGQLSLSLLAIPMARIDGVITQLERVCGQSLSRLTVAGVEAPGLNLLGRSRASAGWLRRLNGNAWLALLLALLLGVLVVSPVLKKRAEVVRGKQEFARLDAQVSGLLIQRQQLERDLSVLTYVAGRRAAAQLPSAVIAELSRVTPDNVHLVGLNLREGRVEFRGFGSDVVKLIELLDASPMFEDVRFTSAVTRDNRSGLDQFSASARLSVVAAGSETP